MHRRRDRGGAQEVQLCNASGHRGIRWYLLLRPGSQEPVHCRAAHPAVPEPHVTAGLSDEDFVRLVRGAESHQRLFMKGRLKVQGNMMLLDHITSLGTLLDAAE
ncbi:SCP2 sterol-binding domain-containing protein [Streptomyces sp. HUAS MG47]|uniref:SCP2 sterol-binding domain-containing protein n=1 Tax=Streptomyces solicamelliae TaxID=3231716 RepID=UPI003877DBB3